MSLVVMRPIADADSVRRRVASVLDPVEEVEAKRSAIAMTSLADVMSASRSSKAEPITSSLFLRNSMSRRSRPAIPMPLFG